MATVKPRDFKLVSGTKVAPTDFNKIRIGNKTFSDDVTATLLAQANHRHAPRFDRCRIERAIAEGNVKELRAISNHFFNVSGIYSRLCRYMAYLFRYDYFITPIIYSDSIKDNKVIEGWYKSAAYLENCRLKKRLGEIALKVILNGCYYGYMIPQKTASLLQELPVDYCRSRFKLNDVPIVEFNIKYFVDAFRDVDYRIRVLKSFPKEIQKAYLSYINGTLPQDFNGDDKGWFPLDPKFTVKFNLSGSDAPLFAAVIPAIEDLDDARDLDKRKDEQELIKILIQQLPIDKNGDLVFDLDEAAVLHANAVSQVGESIGIKVLTTFADVSVEDLEGNEDSTSNNRITRASSTVYDEAGVSQMQFNTDGNLALTKSIANDEATMRDLLLQFETYIQRLLEPFNKNVNKLLYRVNMLQTTVYNYTDMSKLYQQQTQIGFSKMLPQVALGHDQSTIIATAYFENELLNLDELFVPPQMSSTMSAKDNTGSGSGSSNKKNGRPELPDDQKSEKTIKNLESAN